ncbi:hypothetical protein HID58_009939 [Brassica napus]|uniref:Uncharacterized protein n=1 Tax=Brassica napus TaxID=3708 RepID=A0ABQ8DTV7_BRANA|nr:hypothetical protein HID58_009939 [Brassica napus]
MKGYNQTSKGFIKFSKEIGESEELNFIKTNMFSTCYRLKKFTAATRLWAMLCFSPLGSLQAKDFIRELLVKETENRLGQRKVLQRLNDINSLKD